MRVKAKAYMYYNKRGYNIGDEYEMDERESANATLLEKLGKIEILSNSNPTPTPIDQTLQTTSMKSEEEQSAVQPMMTDPEQIPPDRGREYRRRDMRSKR